MEKKLFFDAKVPGMIHVDERQKIAKYIEYKYLSNSIKNTKIKHSPLGVLIL